MGHSSVSIALRASARRVTSNTSYWSQQCPHWPPRVILIQRHARAVSFHCLQTF